MAHGSVMQLENGKFRVCFEYGFDENGRPSASTRRTPVGKKQS